MTDTAAITASPFLPDKQDLAVDAAVRPDLERMLELPPDDAERARLRADVIERCVPLAVRLASRFRNRGEDFDDLTQVAMLGLIHAVDRFDPRRPTLFEHFAVPTILGELKRHFRDRSWAINVHRTLQEHHLAIRRILPELCQRLQRTPSVRDIADALDLTVYEVVQAQRCAVAYTVRSLNTPVSAAGVITELGELIGEPDSNLEMLPDRYALRQSLTRLPEREKLILSMRFVDDLSQAQIAEKFGISQMHVSRLLTQAFKALRRDILRP